MNKVMITSAIISKGYEGKLAFRYNETRDCVHFKIGYTVYDKRAENNSRWININVTAFKPLVERIEKMGLKEGSYISVSGKLDENVWEDKSTNSTNRAFVIILDEVEISSGSGSKKQSNVTKEGSAPVGETSGRAVANGGGFGGFDTFGYDNTLY